MSSFVVCMQSRSNLWTSQANLGQSVSAAELLPLAPHFSRYLDVDEIPSGLAAPIAGSGEQDDLSGQYPRWPYPSLLVEALSFSSFILKITTSLLGFIGTRHSGRLSCRPRSSFRSPRLSAPSPWASCPLRSCVAV